MQTAGPGGLAPGRRGSEAAGGPAEAAKANHKLRQQPPLGPAGGEASSEVHLSAPAAQTVQLGIGLGIFPRPCFPAVAVPPTSEPAVGRRAADPALAAGPSQRACAGIMAT